MGKRYIDENGYARGKLEHSNLIHRQIAYKKIYLKNKKDYNLPFSKYVVHHRDGNKLNNSISNLQIMTQSEHEIIHGIKQKDHESQDNKIYFYGNEQAGSYEHTDANHKFLIIIIVIISIGLMMNDGFMLHGLALLSISILYWRVLRVKFE